MNPVGFAWLRSANSRAVNAPNKDTNFTPGRIAERYVDSNSKTAPMPGGRTLSVKRSHNANHPFGPSLEPARRRRWFPQVLRAFPALAAPSRDSRFAFESPLRT